MYVLIHTRKKTKAVGRSLPLPLHVCCAVYDGVLAGLIRRGSGMGQWHSSGYGGDDVHKTHVIGDSPACNNSVCMFLFLNPCSLLAIIAFPIKVSGNSSLHVVSGEHEIRLIAAVFCGLGRDMEI